MLVFPRGDRVELVFGDGPPVTIGRWATRLGVLLFLIGVLPGVGAAARRLRGSGWASGWPRSRRDAGSSRRSGAPPRGHPRRVVLVATAAFILATGAVVTAAAILRKVPVETLYREGLALFNAGKNDEARPFFQAVQREAPLSTTAIHSRYFEAHHLLPGRALGRSRGRSSAGSCGTSRTA